ncbi:MAG: kinase [Thermoplasmata archaeon]
MRRISVFAPYRVSFFGGGTDIPPFSDLYGGCVINATIDMGMRVRYVDDGKPLEISSRDMLRSWSLSGLSGNEFMGRISDLFEMNGITTGRLTVSGDVPAGTGLGSSTSLVQALLTLIRRIKGEAIDTWKIAQESYRTERDHFHVTLGLQDPYAIPFPGLKYVEFSRSGVNVERLDQKSNFLRMLERSSMIVYTGSTRNSSDELQNEVSKLNSNSEEMINTLLEIKAVTIDARSTIVRNDMRAFCDLMNRSWELKKKLGRSITNERVEFLINTAMKNGACAAKLMGGGSAGFILAIAPPEKLWNLETKMMEVSEFVTRVSYESDGIVVEDSS